MSISKGGSYIRKKPGDTPKLVHRTEEGAGQRDEQTPSAATPKPVKPAKEEPNG